MLLELIAAIIAAVGTAGIVLVVNKLLGGRLPKWSIPAAAGLTMITISIHSDYDWFPRQKAALREGVVVAQTIESKGPLKPWTYLKPFVDKFIAVDMAGLARNPNHPNTFIATLQFQGRWSMPSTLQLIADCTGGRHAPLVEGAKLLDDGSVTGVTWSKVPADDPLLQTICAGT